VGVLENWRLAEIAAPSPPLHRLKFECGAYAISLFDFKDNGRRKLSLDFPAQSGFYIWDYQK